MAPEPLHPPIPADGIAAQVIKAARGQVGYREGRKGGHPDNAEKYAAQVPGLAWANFQPWCAVFVAWCARQGGAFDLFPITASCDTAAAWFKDQRRHGGRVRWSEYPAVGAQVFYGTPGDLTHTGLVIGYDEDPAGEILTVEGNTNLTGSPEGDGTYQRTRRRRDAFVVGYGYPAYPEGIVSADPAWAGDAPRARHTAAGPSKPSTTPPSSTSSKPSTSTSKPAPARRGAGKVRRAYRLLREYLARGGG